MDIDIQGLIKSFINRFIVDESKEMAMVELKYPEKRKLFVKSLIDNKDGILDRRLIKPLNARIKVQEVIEELKLNKTDLCYVISVYSKIDDKVIQIDFALNTIQQQGVGGLIVNLSATRIYFETASGSPEKFIGEVLKN